MEEQTQEDIEHFIATYETIRNHVSSDAVALGVFAEVAKAERMRVIQEERSASNDVLATKKQLNFLGQLAIDHKSGLTKAEATQLIDAALAERNDVYKVPQRMP